MVGGAGAKLPPPTTLYYVNKEDMVEGRKVGGRLRRFLLPSSSTNLSCLRGEIKFGKVGASLPFPNLYFHVNKLCWVGKVSYCTHIHNGPDDLISVYILGFTFPPNTTQQHVPS